MTRQQVLGEILKRMEGLGVSRRTRKLAVSLRGQRIIWSLYELERRRLTRGTWVPMTSSPEDGEMSQVLALAEQVAREHHQEEQEGTEGCG